jgi:hypothetical protein
LWGISDFFLNMLLNVIPAISSFKKVQG